MTDNTVNGSNTNTKPAGTSFVRSLLNAWSWLFLILILGFFEIYAQTQTGSTLLFRIYNLHVILAATPQLAAAHPMPEPDHAPTLFVEISNRLRRDARVIAGLTRVYNAISRVPMFAQKALAHMYRKSPADLACLEDLFRHPHLCEWLRLIANHATLASVDELTNLQRNWPKDLRELQCGVTFVHGIEDPISPIEDIRSVAKALPDAAFHAVENAGHLIFTQHFKDFVDHIATLARPAPSAPSSPGRA